MRDIDVVWIGLVLGSLLTDVDTEKSKLMQGRWRYIGRPSRYIVTKPLSKLLGRKLEHRGILHSLLGLLYTSIIFAIVFLVPFIISVYFTSPIFRIWYIWFGIIIGFLLHLVEDSFTKSGVKWFFPKGLIRSTTITNSASEHFLSGIMLLVFCSWAVIAYYLIPASLFTFLLLVVGGTLVLILLLYRINPRISEVGNNRYSTEELVEFYIEDMGGKKIKSREPCGVLLKIEPRENPSEKQHIAKIHGLHTQYGLDREWLVNSAGEINCSSLEEGDIIELQKYENHKKERIYYIVQAGIFIAYLKRYL